MNGTDPAAVRGSVARISRNPTEGTRLNQNHDHEGVDRYQVPGGWVVTSCSAQADEGGVRWVSFTFFPESDYDLEDPSGRWPRDPSISSKTARLRRKTG